MRLGIRVRPLGSGGLAPRLGMVALVSILAGCGGRTLSATPTPQDAGPTLVPVEARCDGLDDDVDGRVDEGFRDALGRYVHDRHCGACGQSCGAPIAHASEQGCALIDELPRCVAESCEPGFGLTRSGSCTEVDARLCLPCVSDDDCGTLEGATCARVGSELRCSRPCGDGCPSGYVCEGGEHCAPSSGSCACDGSSASFELSCQPPGAPAGCAGRARCEGGTQSECLAPEEGCDGEDDDCDGRVDETFVDELGSYSVSDAHCGACGIACVGDDDAGIELTCGGDPFAPSCVTACPDLADGVVNVGDRVDANRVIEDGCECVVRSTADVVGRTADDEPLDANCDGADGSVLSSFYVSVEGDDDAPGSPTRPLRSLNVAIARAAGSLRTNFPRPHVFVASGVYLGTVRLLDGVQLHGGFRGDFLAQSAEGFEVIVLADAATDAPGGAALVIERGGGAPTLVEGISFRGRDADQPGAPAVGVIIDDPGTELVLRDLRVRTGRPADGLPGEQGDAGRSARTDGEDGQPQRAAVEDASHLCIDSSANVARGGDGSAIMCADGADVRGGRGGDAHCPVDKRRGQSGAAGQGVTGSPGGLGGLGGDDVTGPIVDRDSCSGVCCGLADFTVPSPFTIAQPGRSGADGRAGLAGDACDDPLGALDGVRWTSASASPGRSGGAGGGGGGGGAGSGAVMNWIAGTCEFADGLGGGGGGGGAGGCGGTGGGAGQSGGAAIGIVLRVSGALALPEITNLVLESEPAGKGGDGGAGGDGGLGRSGGFGGAVDDELRSIPTLAGPMPGQRGGKGGRGGSGGGGGGGCGGPSVGIWVTGAPSSSLALDDYRDDNTFELGPAGEGGLGGGGGVPAAAGEDGASVEVVAR